MEEENYYHLELPIEVSVLYIQDYLRRSKNGLEEILGTRGSTCAEVILQNCFRT